MTTKDLCKRLNVTPRALQWWCDKGIVKHSMLTGVRGYAGGSRSFDDAQALTAAVVVELRHKGVSLHRIRKLKLSEFAADYLVVEAARRRYCYCTEDELLPYLLGAPGGCYVVCIRDLRARLQAGPQKARKAVA